jgi:type VI secretion system protein VasG
MPLDPDSLVAKLNATCKSALVIASKLTFERTHYELDLEHLLLSLSEMRDSDVAFIYRYFNIDVDEVRNGLKSALNRTKSGNSRSPVLSPRIKSLLSEAWTLASIEYDEPRIRSGFVMLALLADESLSRYICDSCKPLKSVAVDKLRSHLYTICASSSEDIADLAKGLRQETVEDETPTIAQTKGKSSLEQYTVNLTASAKAGKIDPVLARDFEVRQIVDILMRRRQNNPILTGEAGVGKTAVVEGFALRIASGDVPPALRNVELRSLDLALLQAGAGMKGEFENRLKSVVADVKSSPVPIVLFIDEAHTMIGAGGQAGQNDAANILKPALARGELRTIAATTWSEYKKYFEKDAALARRFQVVKVDEPTEQQACIMLRGVKATLEEHHSVIVLDEAITSAVRLSHRYMSGRQLPDKAVSVLDTACARVSLAQNATPASLEDSQRQIASVETEINILEREAATGAAHQERLKALDSDRETFIAESTKLKDRLELERALVVKILELRKQIEDLASTQRSVATMSPPPVDEPTPRAEIKKSAAQQNVSSNTAAKPIINLESIDFDAKRIELDKLVAELKTLQGEHPMVRPCVDGSSVAEVISGWTGIPLGKMLKDEIQTVLKLGKLLGQRVIGQDHALQSISQRIQTSRAGLDDPRRPIGVFLLVGPSGVGKTETALALADTLYGGERNLVVINMSEYQEAHSVSGLKGSPPGYVGFGEGGVLTEAVRRKPYCVVLLDEMEKAHMDVMELFYQVFDKGLMEDAEGREVNFKNTVIIMTSNAASDQLLELCAQSEGRPEPEELAEALSPYLRRVFKPALLGRLIVVPYFPMNDASLNQIIRLKLGQVAKRLSENYHVPFTFSDELVTEIRLRCTEVESGARSIDHILTGTLLPELSTRMLQCMVNGDPVHSVSIAVGEGIGFTYDIS